MANNSTTNSLPGIAPLSPSTARQIGSGQVLIDPSSLVKELIDNALDARAKSIFVDITANSIDSIQVKDDGHGIPADDRALVCRRHCTSKIRDLCDPKELGGQWLGFRGEALSSMTEMSGTLSVTTRVEGEPIAVKLTYSQDGELATTKPASHPVGTTVKVTHFFEHIPVRKQTAVKNSARCLAKIRRLMQAYALARPAVRLRLHVLKAINTKGDFVYSPKTDSSIQDAVLKAIGNDCALQCDWTAIESDGFQFHAFLPKPTATCSKIANQGAYISVDSRPVCSTRGTMKQVMIAFKERLRKSSPSLAVAKDPFFCLNIICPPNSYDPNIEPAKDDVLFEDVKLILSAIDRLLKSYYSEPVIEMDTEPPTSAQPPQEYEYEEELMSNKTPQSVHAELCEMSYEKPTCEYESRSDHLQWRANMYGIDEDDLVHLQPVQPPDLEEEEGRRVAEVSNPWTIACMNATIKPSILIGNGQILSSAKSHSEGRMLPSSPAPQINQVPKSPVELSTPQLSSEEQNFALPLKKRLEHKKCSQSTSPKRLPPELSLSVTGTGEQTFAISQSTHDPGSRGSIQPSPALSHNKQTQTLQADRSSAFLPQGSDDNWFGQPMRGFQNLQPPRRKQRHREQRPLLTKDIRSSPRRMVLPANARLIEKQLYSDDNMDIRDFFRNDKRNRTDDTCAPPDDSSYIPANLLSRSPKVRSQLLDVFDKEVDLQPASDLSRVREPGGQIHPSSQPLFASATSFGKGRHVGTDAEACSMTDHFKCHEDTLNQSLMSRPSSVRSRRSSLVPMISNKVENSSDLNGNDNISQDAFCITPYFKAYQDLKSPLVNTPSSPARRRNSHITPFHEYASKSRPQQRRITAGPQRTKSSKLSLERVPHGCHVQNVLLYVVVSIACIIQRSLKLDMRRNSTEWFCPAEEVYNSFAEPASEKKIMSWVIDLDAILTGLYEQLPGADVRCMLHEAIQRGFDERKEDQTMHSQEIIRARSPIMKRDICVNAVSDDRLLDFDQSQSVDLDAGPNDDAEPELMLTQESIKTNKDQFGDDMEDDMLLDL